MVVNSRNTGRYNNEVLAQRGTINRTLVTLQQENATVMQEQYTLIVQIMIIGRIGRMNFSYL